MVGILKSRIAPKIEMKHLIKEASEKEAVATSLRRFNNPQG